MKLFQNIILILTLLVGQVCFGQYTQTKVSGKVTDAKTGEALPFVNVAFVGKNIGTITDMKGNFKLVTQWGSNSIQASFVGYQPKTASVKVGEKQTINFALESTQVELQEVVIKAGKRRYRNKENPAVALIRKAIANKEKNRIAGHEYYEYEKYEKDEFDLNNFTERFMKSKTMKPFKFVFEHIDTSEVNGKPYIPLMIREKVSKVYFRKTPKLEREELIASKFSGIENTLDDESISQFIESVNEPIDVYDNDIYIVDKQFTSPISIIGPTSYRYYITDTLCLGHFECIKLVYQPRNPNDVAFKGEIYITDSASGYAVKKVVMQTTKNINVNFLNDLKVEQEFDHHYGYGWLLQKDKMTIDMQLMKKSMGLYNTKTVYYNDYIINKKRPQAFYSGVEKQLIQDSAYERNNEFWNEIRHEELTEKEKGIYIMVDSIGKIPAFKRYTDIIAMLVSGNIQIKWFDLGPVFTFYSWNPVEGHRFRIGGRTNHLFHKNLHLQAYAAYGTDDNQFKYAGSIQWYFSRKPTNILRISYMDDIIQPGMKMTYNTDASLFQAIRLVQTKKMMHLKELKISYDREWGKGWQNRFQLRHVRTIPKGSMYFQRNGESTHFLNQVTSSEVTIGTRYAPNEKFVQGRFKRTHLRSRAPVFELDYTYGFNGVLNSDYEYHRARLNIVKRILFGPLGHMDTETEFGAVFNKVPYPLLAVMPGNETFSYNDRAFNLMNFYEFVADRYVLLHITHFFGGFFLNKIPVFKKLKWRTVATFKGAYGIVTQKNADQNDPGLFKFVEGMHTLENMPYMEASIGIENIFKVLRVDYVQRLSYLGEGHQDVPNLFGLKGAGIRFKARIKF